MGGEKNRWLYSFTLTPGAHARLRRLATVDETNMSRFVESLINKEFDKRKAQKARKALA